MIRQMLPHPVLTVILILIWLLLVNSFAPGHILLAVIFGFGLPLFTRHFWPEPVQMAKPLTLLRYLGIVLYDILVANLTVARLILGRPKNLQPHFVEVPLDLQTDLAISMLANTITLTPGTVSAQLSADRRCLIVHALHETDTEALVKTIKQRYEVPLKEIFES